MTCGSCGAMVGDNAVVCGACGAPASLAPQKTSSRLRPATIIMILVGLGLAGVMLAFWLSQ